MINHAQPTLPSAAASNHGAASHSLALLEARQLRDALKLLLRKEQSAMAEFLRALSDFDLRRGWEALGHASLFAFLVTELRLSKGAAYVRFSAARLIQAHPEALVPLRDGRLCLSSVGELARVATPRTFDEVLPRFFGCSSREAREVAAAIQPREAPPSRDQVTRLAPIADRRTSSGPNAASLFRAPSPEQVAPALRLEPVVDSESVRAHEPNSTHPSRVEAPRDDVEPLSAELRRLHVTVSKQFLKKLEAARAGLSHAIPGATTEQVLEAALDLLLEKQARARGQVKKPRKTVEASMTRPTTAKAAPTANPMPCAAQTTNAMAMATATIEMTSDQQPSAWSSSVARPEGRANDRAPDRRGGPRETIPAAVRRAVWQRDAGRCSWPLDSGGCCGSTHRLELDHVVPWAKWGDSTEANLRLACHAHNRLAARKAFGERVVGRYGGRRAGGAG